MISHGAGSGREGYTLATPFGVPFPPSAEFATLGVPMDYTLPAVLFVLGFAGALLASGVWKWNLGGHKTVRLPVEDGAVRLDLVAKGRPESRGANGGAVPREAAATQPSATDAPPSGTGNRAGKPRARGRR